jgi:hypothetical protein
MNGSAGSSRPKRLKQEFIGSNGAVPASEKENGDPVVGLAVRIVEIIATSHTLHPLPLIGLRPRWLKSARPLYPPSKHKCVSWNDGFCAYQLSFSNDRKRGERRYAAPQWLGQQL